MENKNNILADYEALESIIDIYRDLNCTEPHTIYHFTNTDVVRTIDTSNVGSTDKIDKDGNLSKIRKLTDNCKNTTIYKK